MANKSPTVIKSHVIVAVKGFVQAISVGTKRWSASVQQDMLNLLSN
jgi:FKBP12-rapamycin complex-associated protein